MPVTPPSPATTAARLAPTLPKNKFGLLRPFSRDRARDFAQGSGDDLLASRVGQVIGSAGEFPWRPDLNAQLDKVRNVKESTALEEFARYYVSQALSTFLPQVLAVSVDATRTGTSIEFTVTCVRTADVSSKAPKTFQANASIPL